MFCNFKKLNHEWICDRCGRRVSNQNNNSEYAPSARCRIPEYYYLNSSYINNEKIIGVGDTLWEILKSLGYNIAPLSIARAKITHLNKKGIDWCRLNQHVIVKWIQQECELKKIPSITKLVKAIVRLAIMRTQNHNHLTN